MICLSKMKPVAILKEFKNNKMINYNIIIVLFY